MLNVMYHDDERIEADKGWGGKAVNERFLSRGKRLDNGEWVTGSLIGDDIIARGFSAPEVDVWWLVDPVTLGQCTGLRDKAGKLIFEGNRVHVVAPGVDAVGVVVWEMDTAAFRFDFGRGADDLWAEMMWLEECYEVIGSVHDNAEEG